VRRSTLQANLLVRVSILISTILIGLVPAYDRAAGSPISALQVATEEGSSFAVSPPTFEVNAEPGAHAGDTVMLENQTSVTREVEVRVSNFGPRGEEGQPQLDIPTSSFAGADWVSITPTRVAIPAKTLQPFRFTISVPFDAEPGGHYAAVIFRSQVPISSIQSPENVVQEIASLILIRVPGDVRELASIESFTARKASFQFGPVDMVARIRNKGNVHFKPSAQITIDNIFGHRVANIPVKTGHVLPDSVRKLQSKWNRKLLWGPYKAKLTVVYGSGAVKTVTARVSFFGFPLLIAVLILLILLLLVLMWLRRRRARAAG
jgi:hypothetical protein